jgi:hypothetical protein
MQAHQHRHDTLTSRRAWLSRVGGGLGAVAFQTLLAQELAHAGGAAPTHFPAKAKRVIQIFLEGGLSQMDTFDPKPELLKQTDKQIPGPEELAAVRSGSSEVKPEWEGARGIAFGSPFSFSRHGESGLEISELFPHLAKHADKLCVVRSMHGDDPAHQQAVLLMNTGETRLTRPSVGSWVTYGMGSENENLPGFVVLYRNSQPIKGAENWQSAFLPGNFQGTSIDTQYETIEKLVANIQSPVANRKDQRRQLSALDQLNRLHQANDRSADERLESRMKSFELAYRMQAEASDVFSLQNEPESIRKLYGESDAARQCILARRLAEGGVRFVQVYLGQWDHHSELAEGIRDAATSVDQAMAGLIQDLSQRGMLEDTLVMCTTEFGRTPVRDTNAGAAGKDQGRDHNHRAFSIWMAGGGVKSGYAHGATDEFGWAAIDKPVHVHDLHATMLDLLGFDHRRLTYKYAGRDFRLTDVHGSVIHELKA